MRWPPATRPRTCFRNPPGRRAVIGARPTIAAQAIAELCAQTVFDDGVAAAEANYRGEVGPALERVIEANTLLSGIGFESGGVTAAHAVAMGFTRLPVARENYLHGEMVAVGLLTQAGNGAVPSTSAPRSPASALRSACPHTWPNSPSTPQPTAPLCKRPWPPVPRRP